MKVFEDQGSVSSRTVATPLTIWAGCPSLADCDNRARCELRLKCMRPHSAIALTTTTLARPRSIRAVGERFERISRFGFIRTNSLGRTLTMPILVMGTGLGQCLPLPQVNNSRCLSSHYFPQLR